MATTASTMNTEEQQRLQLALQQAHKEVAAPLSTAEIARRLKEARTAKGWTQEELAARAGISRSVVIRELEAGIERERNPLTLVSLARTLGQAWDWLGPTPPAAIPPGPGRALYTARLARGWTLEQLAAAADVGMSTIHKLEHGTLRGTRRTWADLARAVGVELGELNPEYRQQQA